MSGGLRQRREGQERCRKREWEEESGPTVWNYKMSIEITKGNDYDFPRWTIKLGTKTHGHLFYREYKKKSLNICSMSVRVTSSSCSGVTWPESIVGLVGGDQDQPT